MRKVFFSLVALGAGVGVGLFFGWYVWPVSYTEAAPARMRQDWKDEAIWMAAQAFAYDRDLEAAQNRLRPLGFDDLGQAVLQRASLAIDQNLSAHHIAQIVRLAAALGARSPRTDSYLGP